MKSNRIILVLSLVVSFLAFAGTARAGESISGKAASAAGTRSYSLWIPSGYDKRKPTPLVMMLHGCMQNPQGLAAISGMNAVADQNNFLVVYPEQSKEANPLQCWNWFDAKHQARDSGEPSILAAVVNEVRRSHKVDAKRVYVAGISAGAAMAVVMGVSYPDIFSAVGVHSGLAFKAATDVQGGLTAMKQGGPDPRQLGLLAFQVMEKNLAGKSARRMPVIVFHGDADPYLNPSNANQVVTQWVTTNDYLDDGKSNDSVASEPARTIPGSIPAGHTFTRYVYNDRSARLLIEEWIVKGLGHAWSGSPAAAPFADPKGPNASAEMWRFFRETSGARHR
jgi:poly(hydroxyalkanoate) depolymerase family esterase